MYSSKYKSYREESPRNQYTDSRDSNRTKKSSYESHTREIFDTEILSSPSNSYSSFKIDYRNYYSPRNGQSYHCDRYFQNEASYLGKSYKETLKPRNRKNSDNYQRVRQDDFRNYGSRTSLNKYNSKYQRPITAKYDLSASTASAYVTLDNYTIKKPCLQQSHYEYLTRSNVEKNYDRESNRDGKSSFKKRSKQRSNNKQLNLKLIPQVNSSKQISQFPSRKNIYSQYLGKQYDMNASISKLSTQNSFSKVNNQSYDSRNQKQKYFLKDQILQNQNIKENLSSNVFGKNRYQKPGIEDSVYSEIRSALQKSRISKASSKSKLEYNKNNYSKLKDPFYSRQSLSASISPQATSRKLSLSNFRLIHKRGEGKFGTIYLAQHIFTSTIYAIKKISKQVIKSHQLQNQLILQIKLQTYMNHPNILKLYGFFDDQQHIYLILQYMQQGSLFQHLKKRTSKLSEKEVAFKIRQIAHSIKYLHGLNIAHRDIKPENIVMSNDVAKLCDFGWATRCDDRRKTSCGTFDYAAPEIIEGKQYDECVDLWCLGVLSFELLTGKVPFYHVSRKQTMNKILRVDKDELVYPSQISNKAKSFVEGLMKKDPVQRTTAYQLLNQPFLADFKQNQLYD